MNGFWTRIGPLGSGRAEQGDDIRRALTETLYASPQSLTIGAATGSAISFIIAYLTRDTVLISCALLICTIAALRSVSAIFFHRQLATGKVAGSRGWECVYELGAWGYAAMLGISAFATLIRSPDPAIHILSVAMAVGYAGGISGRNAGQVDIAVGQVLLALGPTAIGLVIYGSAGYFLLGLSVGMMILGLSEITRTTHRIVVEALQGKQEKAKLAATFERLARYDSLTGVENRMAMQMRLRDMYEHTAATHDAFAILWLDLDRFKEINDSLGHIVGDGLLCAVIEKLNLALDGRGHVARFGGDEFVLLCPEMDRKAVLAVAEDVLSLFRHATQVGSHNLNVTVSIGVAVAPQDGRDMDELMQHADLALYEAKRQGRNRAVSFTWAQKERFHRLHEIETGLRRCIENDELVLHFQPIFDLRTGQVAVCEALLRWEHPTLGIISPVEFIPAAESIGMIDAMTEWVLHQACRTAMKWPDHVRIAVNVSPSLMKSADLPANVISALMSSGLPARRLELEVTESIFLDDDGHTSRMLRDLQRVGLRLVLDDFGTGYSSLSYLRSYRFDGIKIDRSFMQSVHLNREDQAIVRAVGTLAEDLNMETVAEGIETEAQLRYARDAGVHLVQGFLLCKPQPGAVITALVNDGETIQSILASRPVSIQDARLRA